MILVSDNIHIVNKIIAKAIEDLDPEPILDLTLKIKKSGAKIVDINPGPLRKDRGKKMAFLINTVQEATGLQLCLDSPDPEVLEAGLAFCKKKPIINGFSLEPHKLDKILPLAVQYETEVVGFLLSPDSKVPHDLDERLSLASTLAEKARTAGLAPDRLIIDPVVVPISWDDGARQARDVLTCIRLLPELLGFPVKTIVGLSNLTSGVASNDSTLLLEQVYLAMLAQAGLDMALLNVLRKRSMATGYLCDAIQNARVLSWAEIKI